MKLSCSSFKQAERIFLLAIFAILLTGALAWTKTIFIHPDAQTFVPVLCLLLGMFLWLSQDLRGAFVPRLTALWGLAVSLWGFVVYSAPGDIVRDRGLFFLDGLSIEEKIFAAGTAFCFTLHLWLKAFAAPAQAAVAIVEEERGEVRDEKITTEKAFDLGMAISEVGRRAMSLRQSTKRGWESKLVFA